MIGLRTIKGQLLALVCGLLVAVVAVLATIAYFELEDVARDMAGGRLVERARSWAELFTRNIPSRQEQLESALRSAPVLAALKDPEGPAREEALAALRRLATNTTAAIELRDGQDRVLLSTGSPPAGPEPPPREGWGPLIADADGKDVWYLIRVPGAAPGSEGACLVERRRVAVDPRARKAIAGLFDSESELLFGNAAGDVWSDLSTRVEAPPADVRARIGESALEYERAGVARFGAVAAVPRTPWIVAVDVPRDLVFAPVRRCLLRLAAASGLVLLLGGLTAWLLSRRISAPLRDLTVAAGAIAVGTGGPRVQVAHDEDELGRLGRAFNRMAEQVEEARRVLEGKVEALRESEDALARNVRELERSNADLQQFAAVASHDLQEPLRKIATFGELLNERASASLDPKSREYLRRMQGAAQHMSGLISSVLELSGVAAPGRPFGTVDLAEVVSDVLAQLEVPVRESGARVDVDSLPSIEADATQMRQLFQNLIANAIKFRSPEREPVVHVSAARTEDGRWRIAVADNGIGFDEKYLDRLFKPFARLHARADYQGSGMGLAICRKIVARHQGEIAARGEVGRGSRFVVTLPERQPAASALRDELLLHEA